MRKNGFLGLFGFLLVIGIIGCGGEDNDLEIYTVTIGNLTNGIITANPTSGIAGTEITLTINPLDWYKLKHGTLKYGLNNIDEDTLKFNLPSNNIIVTAEFESLLIGTWKKILDEETDHSIYLYFTEDILITFEGSIKNKTSLAANKGNFTFTNDTITFYPTHYLDNVYPLNDQWKIGGNWSLVLHYNFVNNNILNVNSYILNGTLYNEYMYFGNFIRTKDLEFN